MGKMVRGFPCKGENRLAQRKPKVSSPPGSVSAVSRTDRDWASDADRSNAVRPGSCYDRLGFIIQSLPQAACIFPVACRLNANSDNRLEAYLTD
jgi:hypothetical protein